MKKINYIELENGMRILTNESTSKQMNMIENIQKQEFDERFPEHPYAWNCNWTEIFLENGVVLLERDWNGYEYNNDGEMYRPVYKLSDFSNSDDMYSDEAEFDIIGYYQV